MNTGLLRRIFLACTVLTLLALPLTALATAEEDANKALAVRLVTEFMLTGDPVIAAELTTSDFVAHDLHGADLDIGAFAAVVHDTITGSIAPGYEIRSLIAEGNLVALRWAQTGCCIAIDHGSASADWTLDGIAILRFAEGKITEMWFSADRAGTPVLGAPLSGAAEGH